MKDIVIILTVFVLGYTVFIGVALFLGKMFFPFFTKEELRKRNSMISIKR